MPIRQKAKQGAEEADPEAEVADGRGDEKAAEAAAVGHVIQREVFVRRPSMVQRLGLGWSRSMRQVGAACGRWARQRGPLPLALPLPGLRQVSTLPRLSVSNISSPCHECMISFAPLRLADHVGDGG